MIKLLKHDFKTLLRPHIIMYVVVVSLSLLTLFFGFLNDINDYFSIFNILLQFFSSAATSVLMVGSLVLVVIRFFKSTLKDEAYLTHTLPLNKHQILGTKLLNGLIYFVLSSIVTSISFIIVRLGGDDFGILSIFGFFFEFLNIDFGIIALVTFTITIAYLSYLLIVYMVLSLGYSSSKNKLTRSIIYGVIAFFVHLFVATIVIAAVVIIATKISEYHSSNTVIYWSLFMIAVFYLVSAIGSYFITYKTLKDNINLE